MSVKTIIQVLAAGAALLATSSPAHADTAVLAGGCFWGMEAVFEHVKGVSDVVSGYAGGGAANARYEAADSGHAEAVRITYDPKQISYAQLLQVFFAVAHDPTQVDRQGPDVGRSYRSAIFPQNQAQVAQAKTFIERLNASHAYQAPIATRIERGGFWPAESYHQDFARKNPFYPYILINDRPKVAALKRRYPALYRG
jgi:peptide-methionine (S)-S-oxide reductase